MRQELYRLLRLSIPVVVTTLGQQLMGLVDTLVVGRAGPNALAGVGAGSTLLGASSAIAMGLLFGLDTKVSQAVGERDHVKAESYVYQGLWLALALSVPLTAVLYAMGVFYHWTGASPEIVSPASEYLKITAFSSLPFLVTICLQRYWQAHEVIRPMIILTIIANIVNYLGDLAFVLGQWGFPRWEAGGVAVATLISRSVITAGMLFYTFRKLKPREEVPRRVDHKRIRSLLKLGVPTSTYIALEVGAFAGATTLAARLGAIPLSAHHIVLTIASLTFMVPLGISSAAAVRVGFWIGANRSEMAKRAGWLALGVSSLFMSVSAASFLLFPDLLFGAFTSHSEVISTGKQILFLAALFQIFDGAQVTLSGALRGLGETRVPVLANLIGHYPMGLALGLTLCFWAGWGVVGLWVGLATGLFVVASMLTVYWWRRTALSDASH